MDCDAIRVSGLCVCLMSEKNMQGQIEVHTHTKSSQGKAQVNKLLESVEEECRAEKIGRKKGKTRCSSLHVSGWLVWHGNCKSGIWSEE